ncbi:hypothetical protein [Tissierella praeacuta]|uniref:hypothetical protein n=1 Tax=Tissierella praeacuta TaxID=43131 RepID=UPI000EC5CA7D|nr:hypothetical protein [Tissierella praeacuta]MBU5257131.1 hypothetical protein [Tissierella praeacuta]HAE91457.1 hypothetical protein [Tissierella sp.]
MWKKTLASLFIGTSIIAISSTALANPTNTVNTIKVEQTTKPEQLPKVEQTPKVEQPTETKQLTKADQKNDISKYQVINPEKDAYSTEDKVIFINGKAPSGTAIVIKVYGTTDLTRKSFNLLKLPTKNDYIEVFNETVKAGNMGFFDKQLDLVTGINKIIIDFGVDGVPTVEKIVYVKIPEMGAETKEVKLTDMIQILK